MEPARRPADRLLVLDAMRGVAAYIVVLHHAFPPEGNPFLAGYLAVDFFFVLSGFVMSQAYEQRFRQGLGAREFARSRVRRLAPPMWIGILLGAACFYPAIRDAVVTAAWVAAAFVCMPLLGGVTRGIFPLNPVQWSLFFELAANALHGSVLWRLRERLLGIIALVSLLVLAVGSYRLGSTAVGDQTDTFLLGFARVGFGYVTGMLLYRLSARIPFPPVRGELPAIGLILLIALVSWNEWWGLQMLATLVMPILVLAGSRATTSSPRLCEYLGRLSFPIYAAHAPIIFLCLQLPLVARVPVMIAASTVAAVLIDRVTRTRAGGLARRRREPVPELARL